MKEGFIDNCYTLIEAFPEIEDVVIPLIQKVLTKQITPSVFSRRMIQIIKEETEKNVIKVLDTLTNEESLAIQRGIWDVVRYKTDIKDAAQCWNADEKFLKLMLKQIPNVEALLKLVAIDVRKKVKLKREVNDGNF